MYGGFDSKWSFLWEQQSSIIHKFDRLLDFRAIFDYRRRLEYHHFKAVNHATIAGYRASQPSQPLQTVIHVIFLQLPSSRLQTNSLLVVVVAGVNCLFLIFVSAHQTKVDIATDDPHFHCGRQNPINTGALVLGCLSVYVTPSNSIYNDMYFSKTKHCIKWQVVCIGNVFFSWKKHKMKIHEKKIKNHLKTKEHKWQKNVKNEEKTWNHLKQWKKMKNME